jgi:hypothetical protein
MIMNIPKVLVSIWGCGPSYRDRVKFTIQKAIDTGYPHILPYIILTDVPCDFDELRSKTDKIIDVIDIHAEREKYSPWSEEFEYLCQEKYDEQKYGEEFVNALKEDKHFSYATHRFVFPRIAELGYNRFLHSDADVDILYDKIVDGKLSEEEFWEQFNTPVNSMKGNDMEQRSLDGFGAHYFNICIISSNILRYEIQRLHPEYNHLCCLKIDYTQTECSFRYYHLADTSMILKYFELWDEIAHIMLPHRDLKQILGGPGYVRIDNIMHSVLTDTLKIKILNFGKEYHHANLPNADRYFMPRVMGIDINGVHTSFSPAKTRAEFMEINKEMIAVLKERGEVF